MISLMMVYKYCRWKRNRGFYQTGHLRKKSGSIMKLITSSAKLAEWDAHLSYKHFSLYMYKNADNLNVVVEDSNANGVELKVCV